MSVSIEALMLEHFRVIRADIAGVRADLQEVKGRLSNVESGLLSLRRDGVNGFAESVQHQTQLDRLSDRIARVENRLNILD